MAEIKEEIMQVLTQMRAEHKTAVESATKSGETLSAEAKANIEKMNKKIDDLEFRLNKQALVLPGAEKGAKSEEQKARSAAFYKWLRNGKAGMEPAERKALVEDATGLILVPEDLEAEIIRAIPALAPLRGICNVRNTNRDKVRVRSLTDVTVGWGKLETGTLISESTMVPTDEYIYAEDLYGLTKVGEDELMDTDANLQSIIAQSFAEAIAAAENTAFAVGTGHTYKQPAGIAVDSVLRTSLESGCGAGDDATYGISWATDDTPIFEDIIKCEYKLPTQYLNGASWLMNRKDERKLRVLRAGGYTATDGPWLWQPSLQVGQPNAIDGYPVYTCSDIGDSALTTAVTNVVFGNFKMGYMIVDRQGITLQRLDELYAESGLVGFKVHFRVGGGLVRYPAFQIIVNDV